MKSISYKLVTISLPLFLIITTEFLKWPYVNNLLNLWIAWVTIMSVYSLVSDLKMPVGTHVIYLNLVPMLLLATVGYWWSFFAYVLFILALLDLKFNGPQLPVRNA